MGGAGLPLAGTQSWLRCRRFRWLRPLAWAAVALAIRPSPQRSIEVESQPPADPYGAQRSGVSVDALYVHVERPSDRARVNEPPRWQRYLRGSQTIGDALGELIELGIGEDHLVRGPGHG